MLIKVLEEIDLNEDEYFGLCWRDKNGLRVSTFVCRLTHRTRV